MTALEALRHRLIVSCQATPEEPMHGARYMAAMARAALEGGAGGIRANGPEDIRAIREAVSLPVIGIEKRHYPDSEVYITPTFECARRVAEAGADLIAIDGTARPRPDGEDLRSLVARIHHELRLPVMADCSCMEDAAAAAAAGVEILATTLSGYTSHGRKAVPGPDLSFISELVQTYSLPVIAEGRFEQPSQVVVAFQRGAYAVVVGGAITRPQLIARRFAAAQAIESGSGRYFAAVSTILEAIAASEGPAIARAAAAIARSIRSGGAIYLSGAGGVRELDPAVPIWPVDPALDRDALRSGGVLIVFLDGGADSASATIALEAKQRGLAVIAVRSIRDVAFDAADRELMDCADAAIDDHLSEKDMLARPVVRSFILNALLAEVADITAAGSDSAFA